MCPTPARPYATCRLFAEERYEDALASWPVDREQAQARGDDALYLDLVAGAALIQLRRNEEAIAVCFRLWTRRGEIRSFDPLKALFNLAMASARSGRTETALAHFRRVLELCPPENAALRSQTLRQLAMALQVDDPEQALELTRRSLEVLGPGEGGPWKRVEEVAFAYNSGDTAQALRRIGEIDRGALPLGQRQRLDVFALLALRRLERHAELVEYFETRVEADLPEQAPHGVDVWALVGQSLRELGRARDAERCLNRAWRLYQRTGSIQNPRLLELMESCVERSGLEDLPFEQLLEYGILGISPPMLALKRQLGEIRRGRMPVLVAGESGTGKELSARALALDGQPFVAVNCRAVPATLFPSLLFGHARGSFTGAHQERGGWVQEADGGVLFLDEVADLPLEIQPLLFRFLDDGSYYRVGESLERRARVRVVAATNRDLLDRDVMRPELANRLAGLRVDLPPLRERGDDLLYLAAWFLHQFNADCGGRRTLGPAPEETLRAWHWPGNVRELRFLVHRACTLSRGDYVLPALAAEIERQAAAHRAPAAPAAAGGGFALTVERRARTAAEAGREAARQVEFGDGFRLQEARRAFERSLRSRALTLCDGNIRAAARLLGESPIGLQRLLKDRPPSQESVP